MCKCSGCKAGLNQTLCLQKRLMKIIIQQNRHSDINLLALESVFGEISQRLFSL